MRKILIAIMLSLSIITAGVGLIGCGNNNDSGSGIVQPTNPDNGITDIQPELPNETETPETPDNSEEPEYPNEPETPEIIFEEELQIAIVENIKTWLTIGGVEEIEEGEVYTFISEKSKFTLTIDLTDYDYLDEETVTDLINSALDESITDNSLTSDISFNFPIVTVGVVKEG